MSIDNLTPDEQDFMVERGSISELELADWELEGLTTSQRMSLEKQRLFLRTFSQRGIILEGCRAAGIGRGAVSKWRDRNWFELLYQAAMEEAADRLEAEAYRRAVDGYEEPVIYQGIPTTVTDPDTGTQRPLTIRRYSDPLMQLLLKGNRPDKYRDNHKVEIDGGATGVLIVPAAVDPEAWAKAAREQQAKYAGNDGSGE